MINHTSVLIRIAGMCPLINLGGGGGGGGSGGGAGAGIGPPRVVPPVKM